MNTWSYEVFIWHNNTSCKGSRSILKDKFR